MCFSPAGYVYIIWLISKAIGNLNLLIDRLKLYDPKLPTTIEIMTPNVCLEEIKKVVLENQRGKYMKYI